MSEDVPDDLPQLLAGDEEITPDDEAKFLEEAFVFPEDRDEHRHEEAFDIPAGKVKEAVIEGAVAAFDTEEQTRLPTPGRTAIESSFFEWPSLENSSELEHYWVNRPYAFVSVLFDEEQRKYRYYVTEPHLDDFEQYVYKDLKAVIRDVLLYRDIEADDRERVFETEVTGLLADYGENLPAVSLRKLQYYLTRDFVGYAEIDPLMEDKQIEDISCVGPDRPVFIYHRKYRNLPTNLVFEEKRLGTTVTRLAQRSDKHISVADPLLDGSLPDGSRIQLTLGTDVSARGSNFTVRKFSEVPFTPVDLVDFGTMTLDMATYLWFAVENEADILFVGGTASGKTTSMNASSFFIPPASKVVSIEDTREITIPHDNWIQSITRESTGDSETGIDMYQLLNAGLRQRPEHLLVGEIRTDSEVALTFFQAISSGHAGYSTFHADGVRTTIDRLTSPPLSVPEQMVQALDIVVHQQQSFLGSRRVRRISQIVELGTADDDRDQLAPQPIYEWTPRQDQFTQTAESGLLERIRERRGWSNRRLNDEFELRRTILADLLNQDATHEQVAGVFYTYYRDAETVMEDLEEGNLNIDQYV